MNHNTDFKEKKSFFIIAGLLIALFLVITVITFYQRLSASKSDSSTSAATSEFSGLDQLQQQSASTADVPSTEIIPSTDETILPDDTTTTNSNQTNETLSENSTAATSESDSISPAIAQASVEDYTVQINNICYSLPFVFSQISSEGEIKKIDNRGVDLSTEPVLSNLVDHSVVFAIGENLYQMRLRSPENDTPISNAMVIGIYDVYDTNPNPIYIFKGIHIGMDIANMPDCEDQKYVEFTDNTYFNYGEPNKMNGEYAYTKITATGNVVTNIEIYKNY